MHLLEIITIIIAGDLEKTSTCEFLGKNKGEKEKHCKSIKNSEKILQTSA